MNTGHVYLLSGNMQEAINHYQKAQSFFNRHGDLVKAFMKDKADLLQLGISEEELSIVLDLLL